MVGISSRQRIPGGFSKRQRQILAGRRQELQARGLSLRSSQPGKVSKGILRVTWVLASDSGYFRQNGAGRMGSEVVGGLKN